MSRTDFGRSFGTDLTIALFFSCGRPQGAWCGSRTPTSAPPSASHPQAAPPPPRTHKRPTQTPWIVCRRLPSVLFLLSSLCFPHLAPHSGLVAVRLHTRRPAAHAIAAIAADGGSRLNRSDNPGRELRGWRAGDGGGPEPEVEVLAREAALALLPN